MKRAKMLNMRLPKLFLVSCLLFTVYCFLFTVAPSALAQTATPTPTPIPVRFGTDSTGFFIKDGAGNVKLRIDTSGYLTAPLKYSPSGDNLIANGGFESDVDESGGNLADNWEKDFQTTCSTCTYSLDTTNLFGGIQSASLTVPAGGGTASIASYIIPVEPGKTYKGFVDAKCNNGSYSFRATVIYYSSTTTSGNTNFTDRSGTTTNSNIHNGICVDTNWNNRNLEFTVPADCVIGGSGAAALGSETIGILNCTRARLLITTSTASNTLNVDNAKITTFTTTSTNASWVSSGAFGSQTGGGNYSFPGNVGIGTTAPASLLDIFGANATISNTVQGNLHIQTSDVGADKGGSLTFGAKVTGSAWRNVGAIVGRKENATSGNQSGYLAFSTNSSSALSEKMRINSTGNVGIGTTGPSEKLAVSGNLSATRGYFEPDISSDFGISIINNPSGYAGVSLPGTTGLFVETMDDTNVAKVGVYSYVRGTTNNKINFYADGNDTNTFSLYSPNANAILYNAGNVGIGTTGPAAKLDVAGTVRVGTLNSGTYSANANVSTTNLITTNTSDIRFKKNVATIDHALAKVLRLRGVTFNWKDDSAPKRMTGMIAQEVLPIMPELVFQNPTDGYYGLFYGETSGLLIEAIKEQQQQYITLDTRLNLVSEQYIALKEKVALQQSQIDSQKLQIENLRKEIDELKSEPWGRSFN